MATNGVGDVRVLQVVHDLRQPMAVMQLWVDLLRTSDSDPVACANHCSRSLARMRMLVEELLAPPADDSPVELSLAVVVEETIKELVAAAEARAVRLQLRVREAPTVLGNAVGLYRAIANVVDNAIRHTPAGTTVRICLDRVGDEAHLDVIDEGPGVPEALRDSVFEPFFTTEPHGSGLGLATARSILRAHGGDIAFLDGAGGIVRIVLPASVRTPLALNRNSESYTSRAL
jgi:signal transduction histidine kinase